MAKNQFGHEIIGSINDIASGDQRPTSVMNVGPSYSPRKEAAMSALDVPLMGFTDELRGAYGALTGEDYTQARDKARLQQEAFTREYPGAKLALQTATGFGLPLVGARNQAVRQALTGSTIPQTIKRGAIAGGATGALTGAGEASELTDVPASMATYGAIGATLGGGAPVVFNQAAKMARNFVQGLGLQGNASNIAERKLVEVLTREGLTPEKAAQNLRDLQELGVPDAVIADLGENLRDLGYASYIPKGELKTPTRDFLQGRAERATGQASTLAQKTAGLEGQNTGFNYVQQVADKQSTAARAKYPEAYKFAIPAQEFRVFSDNPIIEKAFNEAKRLNQIDADLPGVVQLTDFGQSVKNAQSIPTEILHQVKKGLDSMIESQTDAVTGKVTDEGRRLVGLKKRFDEKIKEANPLYAQANKEFADYERLKSSYRTGFDYNKVSEAELLNKLKTMSPAEKESFRNGFVSKMQDALANTRVSNPSAAIFKSDKQKSVMRYAFDNEADYKRFVQQLKAFDQQAQTNQRVIGGSQTREREQITADAGQLPEVLNMTKDAATGNIAGVLNQVTSKLGGVSPDVADQLRKRLFVADPAEQQRILNDLAILQNRMNMGSPLRTPGAYSLGIGTIPNLLSE